MREDQVGSMRPAADRAHQRRLAHELVWLAWPAMLQGLVTTILLFTHRLFLGRYATDALGSMGVSGPLLWSVFSVFGAYGAGIVAVIGRAVGAGDRERANATLRSILVFALLVGLGVAVVGWALSRPLASVLAGGEHTSGAVRAMAVDYMRIVFAVAPLHFVATAAGTAMQASGDTRTPMLIGGVAGVMNLVLTWLLVDGHAGLPELGVRGAALGTAATFTIECVLSLLVLRGRTTALGLGRRAASSRAAPLGAVLRVSGPALVEKIFFHTAYVVFTGLIGHLGNVAMAAHQSLIAIESISFVAAEGLGVAAGALVAQKLGARRVDDAERACWLAVRLGAAALSVVSLLFLIWPEACVRIFTDDPEVVALGAVCLRVAAIAQPVMAVADVLSGALRGAGDTVTPLRAAIIGPLIVRLTACWALAYVLGLGLAGIWIGSTLDWIVRAAYLARAFRKGRWRTIEIKGASNPASNR